ncbi:MAG: hypothetical protein WD512_05920, partial [Candidatus Paceibacterota bacterium]
DDDEDDTLKQYLAYISTRALAEQGSQTAPFSGRDILGKLKSPIAGYRYLEQIWNIPILLHPSGSDLVKKGQFKGFTKRQKALLQMHYFKNLLAPIKGASAYRSSNTFMRSNAFGFEYLILQDLENDEE